MPVPVTIPRLGWSMDEGTFVGWLKGDGAEVRAGEPLFELEGEKALQQVESIDSGILRIDPLCPVPGTVVPVGTLLGHLLAPGETWHATSGPAPSSNATSSNPPSSTVAAVPRGAPTLLPSTTDAAASVSSGPATASNRSLATPRARRAARLQGVQLDSIRGTGRHGRIRERDVLAAAPSSGANLAAHQEGIATPARGTLVPHTPHRRTIAQRMQAGGNVAAPVTLTCRVDATNLVNLRRQFQAAAQATAEKAPSYTEILVKLAAIALERHPRVNSSWTDEGLLIPSSINIGIAVDTPAGLVVPVIRDVPRLSLREIATRTRELVALARARRLTAADQADGTFTVTNLGMFGIDAFTPIVNLPQAAILGVGRIVREPVVRGEQIVPADMLTLNLTLDHRVLDGAEGARFLADLTTGLENPAAWLVA